jgi:peptide/nickel transport system ATP-binding protein
VTAPALLEAEGLRKSYPARGASAGGERVRAVDGVDLVVDRGATVGIVGGSGSGKSTLIRLLVALERPDAGVVRFDGHEISAMRSSSIRPLRRRFQVVFQDSLAALDPRMRISAAVAEPLDAFAIGTPAQRRERVAELLDQVGLDPAVGRRLPAALSGGERQRAAIARALAPSPELVLLDEPVSSLDAPVATQVIDLLAELRARLGLTVVLVTHDLTVVRELCDGVVVLEGGRVVERGVTGQVLAAPVHPTTRGLLDAVPVSGLRP